LAFEINAVIEGTGLVALIDRSVDMDAIGRAMFETTWGLIEARGRVADVPSAEAGRKE
jgi:hypothetical protein